MDEKFIKIFNQYKGDIFRLAFSYTKNKEEAEDITQEVFIKLYKRIMYFENDEHIKKWCVKVTVNECKNLFLSAWKRKKVPVTEELERNLTLENDHQDNDILEALFELPKKNRLIIFLYYYEGYKINEIADMMKINESTIQTILSRSREKLRNILKEE